MWPHHLSSFCLRLAVDGQVVLDLHPGLPGTARLKSLLYLYFKIKGLLLSWASVGSKSWAKDKAVFLHAEPQG